MKFWSAITILMLIAVNLVANTFAVPVSQPHTVSRGKKRKFIAKYSSLRMGNNTHFLRSVLCSIDMDFVSVFFFVHRLRNRWWKFHSGIVCATSNTTFTWWDDAEITACPCCDDHSNNSPPAMAFEPFIFYFFLNFFFHWIFSFVSNCKTIDEYLVRLFLFCSIICESHGDDCGWVSVFGLDLVLTV